MPALGRRDVLAVLAGTNACPDRARGRAGRRSRSPAAFHRSRPPRRTGLVDSERGQDRTSTSRWNREHLAAPAVRSLRRPSSCPHRWTAAGDRPSTSPSHVSLFGCERTAATETRADDVDLFIVPAERMSIRRTQPGGASWTTRRKGWRRWTGRLHAGIADSPAG